MPRGTDNGADGLLDVLSRPVLEVAPRLLGAVLRHGGVAVRLTEVEAYDGANDPGSHAFRGPTRRNEVMFGPAGHLYVYFTYGMHHCANIVCGREGAASAVLMRAGEVVDGLDRARTRRGGQPDRDLARGPARLCSALGLDLTRNGLDLSTGALTLGSPIGSGRISTGPRVGLRHAAERPWRFWLTDDPTVSRYVAAKPRPRTR
jgi:DNA-3-methyladenine glycosylase